MVSVLISWTSTAIVTQLKTFHLPHLSEGKTQTNLLTNSKNRHFQFRYLSRFLSVFDYEFKHDVIQKSRDVRVTL